MKKILALWAVPRSTSTAFERMMRERGDFLVHDEPFGLSFYYSEERHNTTRYPDIEPNAEYNFGSILENYTVRSSLATVLSRGLKFLQTMPFAIYKSEPEKNQFRGMKPL